MCNVERRAAERVQVLILVVQGLSQKQRQLMQQYFELVGWQELKLPSAEMRHRDSSSFHLTKKWSLPESVLDDTFQHFLYENAFA